jgi:phage terminase large subunit GpA-like protein
MSAKRRFAQALVDALRPDARVSIASWATQERWLPPDTPEPGQWRNTRTPYLIDIMNTMSPGTGYTEGWVKKGHQLGGSAAGENFIGHAICTAAGSMLVVFPTLDDAKQWEMTRFEAMRRSSKVLRQRVRPPSEKGADNTKLRKKYPGGVMRLVSANRVGALKSSTIRYIKLEEPDEFPAGIGNQGDPITLARKRGSNFGRKFRLYADGTPTVEGSSAIDNGYKTGDQRKYHLCCPDCGHGQPLVWSQFKWVDGDPETVKYACIDCGALNTEATWKGKNWGRQEHWTEAECKAAGVAYWEATAVGRPGIASWHLPALIAPIGWRPWPGLVQEWLDAQGDEEKLKAFKNTVLGECYADSVRTEVGADALQQRAERYDLMTCPMGGLIATAGVDVQDNRLAVVIRAFGRGQESWGVWHGEIYGSPAAPETWGKLRDLLSAPIKHESGQIMRVEIAAIDTGGHHAEDVYAFCREAQLRGKHWFAIKGAASYDAPKIGKPKKIDFTWRGQPVPGGVELRMIGTQSIKNLIASRLDFVKPGGGHYHFPIGFQADYYKQLRGEKRQWKRDARGKKFLVWVKTGQRNEAWDCEVYAYAALLYGIAGSHEETVWRNREKIFGKVIQADMFDGTVQTPAPAPEADTQPDLADQTPAEQDRVTALIAARRGVAKKLPRPRKGFVNNWNR